jgi:hypothetical protein
MDDDTQFKISDYRDTLYGRSNPVNKSQYLQVKNKINELINKQK